MQNNDLRVLIVSGADSGFFHFLLDTVDSLISVRDVFPYSVDIAAIDCDLEPHQKEQLRERGVILIDPEWPDFVPAHLKLPKHAPRFVRPRLPNMAPGYDIIVWIDADAWVQDGNFLAEYVEKARDGALSIVLERERAYKWQWHVFKWNVGNNILSFGLLNGIKLSLAKPINNGVFALRADAPHWAAWEKYYAIAVKNSGKFYSQLAMAAGLYLDDLPVNYVDSRFNWITSRGRPAVDKTTMEFYTPYSPPARLSVIHMAGPEKNGQIPLKTLCGTEINASVRWPKRATISDT